MGSEVKQVLVVASKTANSDRLMKEIEARAATEGCSSHRAPGSFRTCSVGPEPGSPDSTSPTAA